MPLPGQVAVSGVLSVHAELGVPGGSEILRHMPHTALLVGWNHSSSETAARVESTTDLKLLW